MSGCPSCEKPFPLGGIRVVVTVVEATAFGPPPERTTYCSLFCASEGMMQRHGASR